MFCECILPLWLIIKFVKIMGFLFFVFWIHMISVRRTNIISLESLESSLCLDSWWSKLLAFFFFLVGSTGLLLLRLFLDFCPSYRAWESKSIPEVKSSPPQSPEKMRIWTPTSPFPHGKDIQTASSIQHLYWPKQFNPKLVTESEMSEDGVIPNWREKEGLISKCLG